MRAAWLPTAQRSRFCLTTVSVYIPTLYRFAQTTRRAQIRSFRWSGTDRPFRPICRSPSADFQSRCVRFPRLPTSPASSTLRRRPTYCSETKIVGRVLPGRLDAAVRSQSPRRSILSRLWEMSRRIFCTCEFPPAVFHETTVPSDRQTGWKRRTQRNQSGHAQHSTGKASRRERTTMKPGGYNIKSPCGCN